MKFLINIKLTFVFLLIFSTLSFGQTGISEEKQRLIGELIVLTKVDDQLPQIVDTIMNSYETSFVASADHSIDQRNDLTPVAKQRMKSSVSEGFISFSKKFRERLPLAIDYSQFVVDCDLSFLRQIFYGIGTTRFG